MVSVRLSKLTASMTRPFHHSSCQVRVTVRARVRVTARVRARVRPRVRARRHKKWLGLWQ
jgi:hypothetical protein